MRATLTEMRIDSRYSELDSTISDYQTIAIGIAFGDEFRKALTDKLYFRYGSEVGVSYYTNNYQSEISGILERVRTSEGGTLSFELIVGLNYHLLNNVLLGV